MLSVESKINDVPEETYVVSTMTLYLETDTRLRDEKDSRPLPHPIQGQRETGKKPSKDHGAEDGPLGEERTDYLAVTKIVKNRHVIIGILPYVKITILKQDALMARSAVFDMLRQKRSPAKSQRRMVRKDQLLY